MNTTSGLECRKFLEIFHSGVLLSKPVGKATHSLLTFYEARFCLALRMPSVIRPSGQSGAFSNCGFGGRRVCLEMGVSGVTEGVLTH